MSDLLYPSPAKERFVILDILRGVALWGICLANYPEFSLYTFLGSDTTGAMPTAGIDTVTRYLQYFFIDGKFYTIFSLLFGIGFTLILSNAGQKKQNGLRIFYRRMGILFLIGLAHLLFLWAGDILILYAFAGLFLPLFRHLSDKKILIWAALLITFPVLLDACIERYGWNPAAPAIHATAYFHERAGITDDNFAVWLAESNHYTDILRFNLAGSFIRLQEFIDGHRFFKVLGIFLLGLYIGRKKLYTGLDSRREKLKKGLRMSLMTGIPSSLLYAWSAMNGYPWGLAGHSVLYTVSVIPSAFIYISGICLLYIHHKEWISFRLLAAPGRMALTNYISQSVFGMIIFYGTGWGLGARTGLIYVEIIALLVFLLQVIYSYAWLHYYQFGPLEWIWRILTYGKKLKLARIKPANE